MDIYRGSNRGDKGARILAFVGAAGARCVCVWSAPGTIAATILMDKLAGLSPVIRPVVVRDGLSPMVELVLFVNGDRAKMMQAVSETCPRARAVDVNTCNLIGAFS